MNNYTFGRSLTAQWVYNEIYNNSNNNMNRRSQKRLSHLIHRINQSFNYLDQSNPGEDSAYMSDWRRLVQSTYNNYWCEIQYIDMYGCSDRMIDCLVAYLRQRFKKTER